MSIYFIKRRLCTGLWFSGVIEAALVLGFSGLSRSVEAGDAAGGLYTFTKLGLGLNGAAFIVLLLGYLFLYRFLGISREAWLNGRALTSMDEPAERTASSRASGASSVAAWTPLLGLLIVVAGLATAVGVLHLRHPSIYEVAANGTVAELNDCLVRYASEIDKKNKEGLTPLMVAVEAGRLDMVNALLSQGASIEVTDRAGRTALVHAIGNSKVVEKLLLKGADPDTTDRAGMAAIHWAIRKESKDSVKQLLQYGAHVNARNDEADTPLLMAVKSGFDVVDLLLIHGASPGFADQIGETPLHQAALHNDFPATQSLLAAGADAKALSMQGWTPLHVASMNGSLSVMALLLHAGVNVDQENERSQTAMTCAILKHHSKVVEYLLDHGADVNRVDRMGNTYLHLALMEEHDDIAAQLLKAGAATEIANHAGITPDQLIRMQGKLSLLHTQKLATSH